MLIKDKDILVEDDNTRSKADKKLDAQRSSEYKEHMSEAWGDAFDYYLVGITSKYLRFYGRATRLELWGFLAASFIVCTPLYFLGNYIEMPMLAYYFFLATLVPTFAVMSRRIHDLNKKSMPYLVIGSVLSVASFFIGIYAGIVALVWWGYMAFLFSKPSNLEDSVFGEPNEEDEIYGLDNTRIINKFRLIAIVLFFTGLGAGIIKFNDWSVQTQQKATIENIMESVVTKATDLSLSEQQIIDAQNEMKNILRKIQGQTIPEEKLEKYIDEAVKSVIPVTTTDKVSE